MVVDARQGWQGGSAFSSCSASSLGANTCADCTDRRSQASETTPGLRTDVGNTEFTPSLCCCIAGDTNSSESVEVPGPSRALETKITPLGEFKADESELSRSPGKQRSWVELPRLEFAIAVP